MGLLNPDDKDSRNLDLLRAAAVSFVFISHFLAASGHFGLGSLGRFGVVLFFIHTSFVLMASLDRSGGDTSKFAIQRAFRIYPLAMLCVAAVPLLHIPQNPGEVYHWEGARALLANLSLTQNLQYEPSLMGPLWSLPLEVEMYVLFPALYFLIRKRPGWGPMLWVLSCLAAETLPRITGRANMFLYGPCFAAGILGYAISRMKVNGSLPRRRLPACFWPLTIGAATLAFHPFDNRPFTLDTLPLAWALSLPIGLAIPFTRDLRVGWLHAVAHRIAKYSYGIYLTHNLVFWCGFDVMRGAPAIFRVLMIAGGTVALPVLLFHFVEEPMIRLGRKLSWNAKRPPVPGAALPTTGAVAPALT